MKKKVYIVPVFCNDRNVDLCDMCYFNRGDYRPCSDFLENSFDCCGKYTGCYARLATDREITRHNHKRLNKLLGNCK
jgi:hypothetical protein